MAYTDDQYAAAADFIIANINDPALIADTANRLGISLEDLTKATNFGLNKLGKTEKATEAQVANWFAGQGDIYSDDAADYVQDLVQAIPAPAPAARTFTDKQYLDVGNYLLKNINTPNFYKTVNSLMAQEGVSKADLLKAAQTVRPGITSGDIDKFLSGNYIPTQAAGDYQGTVTGGRGVDFKGSTGLREAYGPYVTDYLSRASALLGLRDSPDYKPIKFGTEATGGTYGGETAKTLADLQTRRESMMSDAKPYTPYNFSFAPDTKPAAQGGIMSLVDHYDAGGTVGNETVSNAFESPTAYNANTYTSGYTAPDTTYTGPGATGITTGSFDQKAITQFTNPYATAVTDPQVREAKRQNELARQSQAAKFSQAGAFGGSRNILAENELGRNLATQIGDIYGRGQKDAYDAALRAFEAEEGRKLTAGIETEKAKQEAGRQALSGAQTAAQLGLDASKLTEQSKQFKANYGLQTAQSEAQYQQLARDLQQRAEEAQARGDQYAANLALQQLQEANRAAEATRQFEYTQARDTYLDPFRELGYASQLLQGLPTSASATGISPATEALISALGLNRIIG